MFLDSVGIILKKNELSSNKIIILDKIQGRIECVTSGIHLSPGSLISYTLQQRGFIYFMSNIDLLYIPLSLARTDMLFFHHVLELIYYFVYAGNPSEEIFDLCAFLYTTEHPTITMQYKKIFLFKLLAIMSIFPEVTDLHTQQLQYLATLDIKKLSEITLNSSHEKELDRWLWCCVWQHPYVKEFKTVHFLAENRTL